MTATSIPGRNQPPKSGDHMSRTKLMWNLHWNIVIDGKDETSTVSDFGDNDDIFWIINHDNQAITSLVIKMILEIDIVIRSHSIMHIYECFLIWSLHKQYSLESFNRSISIVKICSINLSSLGPSYGALVSYIMISISISYLMREWGNDLSTTQSN